ncbi:hypothetical protein JOC78_001015 [Bacillus ectoiniformans]|uniref:DUF3888 domain-containing protein n=1 Tax=Bacillus ectoiniformans TaxID=1494429 RepID=UPI00195A1B76|nr:DUF3888 domain-containing protein [Bacillus ectoiniformans]MBM7648075.1 hypothetical protein [Bacillus ectoiniformans]
MRKVSFFLLYIMLLTTVVHANGNTSNSTKPTRENILEDATLDLLQPQITSAIEDYYGTTFNIGFYCQKIISIKKLEHPGSMLIEAKLEGVTYKGAHNPIDIFTITVKKDQSTEGKWVMQEYKVKKFRKNEKYECRDPA